MRDAALLLETIAGFDPRDSTSADRPVPRYTERLDGDVRGLRVGVPREYFVEGMDADVEAAVRGAIRALEGLGAVAVPISLPHSAYALATYYLIATAEASSNLARYDGIRFGHRTKDAASLRDVYRRSRDEGFGAEVKRRIMLGTYALSAGYYDAYYGRAQRVRTLIRRDFEQAFDSCDVIAAATAPTPAFPLGEKMGDPLMMYLTDVLTLSVNLAGLPGLSIPCGADRRGLPIGLQLIGRSFGEEELLRVGFAAERAR